jgi:hypothetical protein
VHNPDNPRSPPCASPWTRLCPDRHPRFWSSPTLHIDVGETKQPSCISSNPSHALACTYSTAPLLVFQVEHLPCVHSTKRTPPIQRLPATHSRPKLAPACRDAQPPPSTPNGEPLPLLHARPRPRPRCTPSALIKDEPPLCLDTQLATLPLYPSPHSPEDEDLIRSSSARGETEPRARRLAALH